ncbi:MAG: hypothetical protein ABSH51_30865 [Solirubrobacteraceae bacterium]
MPVIAGVRRAAVAVLGVAALTGCGSATLSAGQVRSAATTACTAARRRTDRLPTPTQPSESAAFLRGGIAALAPELTALAGLRPVAAQSADWNRALRAQNAELVALRAALRSLQRGADPVTTIAGLQRRLTPLEVRAGTAWRALAVPACATQ